MLRPVNPHFLRIRRAGALASPRFKARSPQPARRPDGGEALAAGPLRFFVTLANSKTLSSAYYCQKSYVEIGPDHRSRANEPDYPQVNEIMQEYSKCRINAGGGRNGAPGPRPVNKAVFLIVLLGPGGRMADQGHRSAGWIRSFPRKTADGRAEDAHYPRGSYEFQQPRPKPPAFPVQAPARPAESSPRSLSKTERLV